MLVQEVIEKVISENVDLEPDCLKHNELDVLCDPLSVTSTHIQRVQCRAATVPTVA